MSKILLWIADNSKETIFSLVLGGLITTIFQNRKNIVIWIKTFFQKEKEFRISYAYLFRIKIENKYLLIKGKRIEQYQPVGGVFKYYNSFIDKYNLWEIKAEKNSNFFEEKDLRIFVKGKYLTKIIYIFLTIFLYLLKCPQSLILSALRAFCFCGKPHISRSIFLYFRYQAWLKSW